MRPQPSRHSSVGGSTDDQKVRAAVLHHGTDQSRHAAAFHADLGFLHPRALQHVGNPGSRISNESPSHVRFQKVGFETELQGRNGMRDDEARLKIRSQVRGPLQDQVALGSSIDSTDDYLGYDGGRLMRFRYMSTCPN